jgi:ubiquinol-cytochrome c reductase iron-sulfur subunit
MTKRDDDSGGRREQDGPETAWEAEGSLVDRLRSAPTSGKGVPREGAETGAGFTSKSPSSETSPRQVDARGELAVRDAPGADGGGAGTRPTDTQEPRPQDLDPAAERRAERQVAGCFLASGFAGIGFAIVFFALDPLTFRISIPFIDITQTVLLGVLLGIALIGIGAGPVIWAKKLMPDEEAVQEREPFASNPEDREATLATLNAGLGDTGIGRRKLLLGSLGFGGLGLSLAAIVPLFGLGPYRPSEILESLETTSFRAGSRLVRENGQAVRIGDINVGGIVTVFPEDNLKDYDAPTMLIRMRPEELIPEPGREDWSIDGHVAYSKICTHLGCPVGLYQQVTHQLLCPCHQSTFLASEGCRVIFGPAARPLPQLAIALDDEGYFIAQGDYSEPIGASYWSRG